MYADRITGSMEKAIDETNRRRAIQLEYNLANGITPKTILKSKEKIMEQTSIADVMGKPIKNLKYYTEPQEIVMAADPVVAYMTKDELTKQVKKVQNDMEKAAKELDFVVAARLRDEMLGLKKLIAEKM
jgi:excinuclease ABC subunit B